MFPLSDGGYGLVYRYIFLAKPWFQCGTVVAGMLILMCMAHDRKITFSPLHFNVTIETNLSLKHIFRLMLGKNYRVHH